MGIILGGKKMIENREKKKEFKRELMV